MDGGSFTLGAGYETAAGEGDAEDIEGMKFGVSVSVDQISFGGGMYEESQGDMSNMEYDVGASIVLAMVDVGVQYSANEKGETSKTALNLTYPLGPGVVIGGQFAAGSSENDEDVTQVLLGTSVSF